MLSDSLLGGGYLLSHFRSTIGVVRLNFSVRNGKRWDPHAMAALLTLRPGRLSTLPNPGGGGAAVMSKRNHRGNAARENQAASNRRTGPAGRARLPARACNRPWTLVRPDYRDAGTGLSLSSTRTQLRAGQESFRVISTARLRTLPPVHLPPIDVVVFNDPQGDLILGLASRLDAFSAYPYPTRLPGRAPGGTTGWPEVGPTRSSRTSVRSPQISSAHNR